MFTKGIKRLGGLWNRVIIGCPTNLNTGASEDTITARFLQVQHELATIAAAIRPAAINTAEANLWKTLYHAAQNAFDKSLRITERTVDQALESQQKAALATPHGRLEVEEEEEAGIGLHHVLACIIGAFLGMRFLPQYLPGYLPQHYALIGFAVTAVALYYIEKQKRKGKIPRIRI